MFDHRCEPQELRTRAEEAERLGRENSLPVLYVVFAPIEYGIATIREGHLADGISTLKSALNMWEAGGGRIHVPYLKCVLAEAMAGLGDVNAAVLLLDEAIAQFERPGWEERFHYAETLRLKGSLLLREGDFAGAERSYQASLDWARRWKAKSWELRTATSLARLWQSQGKTTEAGELLEPIYGWFTEGFGTNDLREAKMLLEELAA